MKYQRQQNKLQCDFCPARNRFVKIFKENGKQHQMCVECQKALKKIQSEGASNSNDSGTR